MERQTAFGRVVEEVDRETALVVGDVDPVPVLVIRAARERGGRG
jgi:hypothetical protein